jgi:hypothetical protein
MAKRRLDALHLRRKAERPLSSSKMPRYPTIHFTLKGTDAPRREFARSSWRHGRRRSSRGEVLSNSILVSSLTLPIILSSGRVTFISKWFMIISVRMGLPQLSQQVAAPCCIVVQTVELSLKISLPLDEHRHSKTA